MNVSPPSVTRSRSALWIFAKSFEKDGLSTGLKYRSAFFPSPHPNSTPKLISELGLDDKGDKSCCDCEMPRVAYPKRIREPRDGARKDICAA